MAGWEHRPCGTVFHGRVPPPECPICQKPPDWIRRSRSAGPTSPQRMSRKSRRRISPSQRARIYKRDGGRCVECGAKEGLTIDHKVPVSKGGGKGDDNLQTMCRPCNIAKGNS